MKRATWIAMMLALVLVGCGSDDPNNPTPPVEEPPNAPTNLEATSMGTTVVRLAWTDNSTDEESFGIQQLTGANWATVQTTAASVTTADVTGLSPDTPYSFRVFASNEHGSSGYTNAASARTAAAITTRILTGTATGSPGMTVAILVGMEGSPDRLTGYSVTITYDPTRVEPVGVIQERLGFPLFEWGRPAANQIRLAATALSPITVSDGGIATARFRIREGTSGQAALAPVAAEMSDDGFEVIAVSAFSGSAILIN